MPQLPNTSPTPPPPKPSSSSSSPSSASRTQLLHALALPLSIAGLSVLACYGIAQADPQTPGGIIPLCPTKALFGINCPGCGSSRMIQALAQGDIHAALAFNAIGLCAVLLLIWSWCAWTLHRVGYSLPTWTSWRYTPHICAIVLVGWFIIRLLPWEPFLSLRV